MAYQPTNQPPIFQPTHQQKLEFMTAFEYIKKYTCGTDEAVLAFMEAQGIVSFSQILKTFGVNEKGQEDLLEAYLIFTCGVV